jgi:hypothetical protein
MTAATVIVYKRGNQYFKNEYTQKVKDPKSGKLVDTKTTAHGLVGELWVHGLCFDAIERMDGYVCLDGGRDYPNSAMYWHTRLDCYVVNPWHQKKNKDGKHAQILIHQASKPSHLEGCIGPGFFEGTSLTLSAATMAVIWEQCGGAPGEKSAKPLVVTLRVEGDMKPRSACTPYTG